MFKIGFYALAITIPMSLVLFISAFSVGLPYNSGGDAFRLFLYSPLIFAVFMIYLIFFIAGRSKRRTIHPIWILLFGLALSSFLIWVMAIGYSCGLNFDNLNLEASVQAWLSTIVYSPAILINDVPYGIQAVGGGLVTGLIFSWLGSFKGGALGKAETEYEAYIETLDTLPTIPNGVIFDNASRKYLISLLVFFGAVIGLSYVFPIDGELAFVFFGGIMMLSLAPLIIAVQFASKYRHKITWKRSFKYGGVWTLCFVTIFVGIVAFVIHRYGTEELFGPQFSFKANTSNFLFALLGLSIYAFYMLVMSTKGGAKGRMAKLAKDYARSK